MPINNVLIAGTVKEVKGEGLVKKTSSSGKDYGTLFLSFPEGERQADIKVTLWGSAYDELQESRPGDQLIVSGTLDSFEGERGVLYSIFSTQAGPAGRLTTANHVALSGTVGSDPGANFKLEVRDEDRVHEFTVVPDREADYERGQQVVVLGTWSTDLRKIDGNWVANNRILAYAVTPVAGSPVAAGLPADDGSLPY